MRGPRVPSFSTISMLKEHLKLSVQKALEAYPSLFLLDFTIGSGGHIKVVLDGDEGVRVQDCVVVSRAIESHLNREEEDFHLEVMSAGAASPLQMPRQYKKNIGRKLQVITSESICEGELTQVSEDDITLVWEVREPKPVGKGKVTVQKTQKITFSKIHKAKVIIEF